VRWFSRSSGLNEPVSKSRTVIVIEDWAHRSEGHFPRRFAELTEAFTALGWHGEVLTSRGWVHETDADPVPFAVSRYGRLALVLDRVASRLQRVSRQTRLGNLARTFGGQLRVMAIVGSARSIRRRTNGSADVVVLSYGIDVVLAAALAGRGRWLFYAFEPPSVVLEGRQIRLESRLAKWAERRRRAQGGGACIVTPYERSRAEWSAIAPFMTPTVLAIAGCSVSFPIPNARDQLGIFPADRIALIFGSKYNKDCDVVWRAFSELEDWRLLIGGHVTDLYIAAGQPLAARRPILIDGFVSNATRELAYSAADLVILSFRPDYERNSGTLMDAISWGIPVVCSERSGAAELVQRFRLGVTFTPGDAQSLANAVRLAPERIHDDDLHRARNDLSNAAVATRFLELFQQLSRSQSAPICA